MPNRVSIFENKSGTNVVSSREIDAHHHAVAGYMNWVQDVQGLSSFLKDGWFSSALVTPAMLELVKANETFTQEYKFIRHVS